MSIIVAVKDTENKKVYMACDSQITKGSYKVVNNLAGDLKMWKLKAIDKCLMGCTGDVRVANLIKAREEELFKDIDEIGPGYKYFSYYFILNLLNEFEKAGIETKDRDGETDLYVDILIAYKDKIFHITRGATLIEVEDYIAVGSGENCSMGTFMCTSEYSFEDRAKIAVDASIRHSIYVDYPINIFDTKDKKVRSYTKEDMDELYDMKKNKLRDMPEAELLLEAIKLAKNNVQLSASYLQRKFSIGYGKASKLMDMLREIEVVK